MYSPSLSVKYALGVSLTANALLSLGTERHKTFYDALWQGKVCLLPTPLVLPFIIFNVSDVHFQQNK